MRRLLVFVMLVGILPAPASAEASDPRPSASQAADIRSDFNGDGYADLAVGIQNEELNGLQEAGGVSVLYGSAAGIQADDPDDQLWTQDSPSVKDQAEELDRFGSALTAGDFDADGHADLAIGVLSETVGSHVYGEGAVEVLYGSPAGLQASAPDDQFWTQDSAGVEDQAEDYDFFGSALSAEDFNGDGFADLAIGVEGEGPGLPIAAGALNVLYGSATGLQAQSPRNQIWSQGSPGVKGEPEGNDADGDNFGAALASGDFNADAFGDLAIGVWGEGDGHRGAAGAVAVLYGAELGLQADAPDDQLWSQDGAGVRDVAEEGDIFGIAVAVADFNGDGYADLAVGAPGEGAQGHITVGAVDVLFGSAIGLQADGPDDQLWSQNSEGVKGRIEGTDGFGSSLGAGDFNADGFADLAIGSDENETGAVAVLYGSAGGLQAFSPDDQLWSQASPGVKGDADGDGFGTAVSSGDFNGDGVDDLVAGVPHENLRSPGAVTVLYGTPTGLQADSPDDQLWSQASPGVKGMAEDSDNFGLVLTSG
jgi:hypothetical protein